MQIAVNTLSVTPEKFGIKTYLVNLLRSLVDVDRTNNYTILCNPANADLFKAIIKDHGRDTIHVFSCCHGGTLKRILCDQFTVPRYLKSNPANILLTPSNIASLCLPRCVSQVVIIQDSLSLKALRREAEGKGLSTGRVASLTRRLYYDLMLPVTVSKADRIVTVSEYLRDMLVTQFAGTSEKVTAIHEGVNLSHFRPDACGRGNRSANAPEAYILFVSTLFPYKKADRLIEAFSLLKKQCLLPEELTLIIAGKDSDGRQLGYLRELSRRLDVKDFVRFLGAVPYEKIPGLYRDALLFVYPSSAESFGLPVLEAMASGVPVICSNRMCLPEVVGDAGILVDPDDIQAVSGAIQRLVVDNSLRDELILRGHKRVESFSWENTAARMIDVFSEVAANKPGVTYGRYHKTESC